MQLMDFKCLWGHGFEDFVIIFHSFFYWFHLGRGSLVWGGHICQRHRKESHLTCSLSRRWCDTPVSNSNWKTKLPGIPTLVPRMEFPLTLYFQSSISIRQPNQEVGNMPLCVLVWWASQTSQSLVGCPKVCVGIRMFLHEYQTWWLESLESWFNSWFP